ncbi:MULTISPECIES: hypothetical protein [unclassified Exiguobacterium]|uniref:hypothetical protein n=1 Tax=unclassified Exiguobacterium TaxID=2644629 RepID=UPI001BE6A829|nr:MULTISPECIES: hypothetical protein [unclassified Exiguobacterium]
MKKIIQVILLISVCVTSVFFHAPKADAKIVAMGYTQLTFPGLEGNEGMRRHSYTWSQERVGKTTYHTIFFKSPYQDDQRQFTSVLMFKIDSKGVQKQVRKYLFRVDGDKPEAFLIRTKTSSPGTYFYHVRSESVFHDDIQGPAYTETIHVLVK